MNIGGVHPCVRTVVQAVARRIRGEGRCGVAATLRRRTAKTVAIHVDEIGPVAVLVKAVVRDLGRQGVEGVVVVVAVVVVAGIAPLVVFVLSLVVVLEDVIVVGRGSSSSSSSSVVVVRLLLLITRRVCLKVSLEVPLLLIQLST